MAFLMNSFRPNRQRLGVLIAAGFTTQIEIPLAQPETAEGLPAERLVKLPDHITYEQGAVLMLKGLTVWYLLHKTFKVEPHHRVLIHAAAGGIVTLAASRGTASVARSTTTCAPWPRSSSSSRWSTPTSPR